MTRKDLRETVEHYVKHGDPEQAKRYIYNFAEPLGLNRDQELEKIDKLIETPQQRGRKKKTKKEE